MFLRTLRNPRVWLGIAISLLAILGLIWVIDLAEVGRALVAANSWYLAAAAGAIVLFLLARAVRWRIMLARAIDYRPVLHVQNIGYMLGMLLPLRLGDIARALLIGRLPPVNFWQGASTMIVERLLDLLVFVILFPFAVANLDQTPPSLQNAARVSGIVALAGLVIFLVMARNRSWVDRVIVARLPAVLGDRARQALDGLTVFSRTADLLQIVLWTMMVWVPIAFSYDWGLRAVGLTLSWWELAFVLCCAAFAVAIPSSPGQLGVFHAAVFFALHTILGYPEAPAVGFALLIHALQVVIYVLLGLLGMSQLGQSWQQISTLLQRPTPPLHDSQSTP